MWSAAQLSQSAPPYFEGQVSHETPVHMLRHWQLQPVFELPVTALAWAEQFASTVQINEHVGYEL